MKSKEELRLLVRDERAKLKPEWIKENSWHAQGALVALPDFKKARSVCCYLSINGEVETDLIIEMCRREGKRVCVPAFRKRMNMYGLAKLENDTTLVAGNFKIMEPSDVEWADDGTVDFVVVPGVAFDSCGGRVGHGRGYYDRILSGMPQETFKAGLSFDFQIYDRVPMTPEDVRMDVVVTEKRVLTRIKGS